MSRQVIITSHSQVQLNRLSAGLGRQDEHGVWLHFAGSGLKLEEPEWAMALQKDD